MLKTCAPFFDGASTIFYCKKTDDLFESSLFQFIHFSSDNFHVCLVVGPPVHVQTVHIG